MRNAFNDIVERMTRKLRYGRLNVGLWAKPELVERLDKNRNEMDRSHYMEKLMQERLDEIEDSKKVGNGALQATNHPRHSNTDVNPPKQTGGSFSER